MGCRRRRPSSPAIRIDGPVKPGSIGVPLQGTVISLRDLADPTKEVPVGEKGEICIKGPQVMLGYYKRPEDTAEQMVGEFLRTGDVGAHGRGRLLLHRGPHQGPHHLVRLQRLSAPHRGGDLRASGGGRGDGHRHPRQEARRGAEGVRAPQAGRLASPCRSCAIISRRAFPRSRCRPRSSSATSCRRR